MSVKTIGVWHTSTERITHSHTSYAADWETVELTAGDYPLNLTDTGTSWLCVGIAATRIAGKTYSGFCGNNFASSDLPVGPTTYTVQTYAYHLPSLILSGKVTVDPEFARTYIPEQIERIHASERYWAEVRAADPTCDIGGTEKDIARREETVCEWEAALEAIE